MSGLAEPAIKPANGRAQLEPAAAYLLERGFPEWAILEVSWRIEPLGSRHRFYGLPSEAAHALVWLIPYPHRNGNVAFERVRLIEQADLERFGGGKYRQPRGRSLALYDPYHALEGPLDAVLLIEGEANAIAVHVMQPELAVLGLPGQSALTESMAEQLGHVPVVFMWIDRHDKGAQANSERIARLLRNAGVEEVKLLPGTAELDANDALREFGPERAWAAVSELLERAEPIEPSAEGQEDWALLAKPALPQFPLDALPAELARFVEAVAVETQTPVDLGALAALGVLSAVALGIAVVDCGNWEEELALYIMAVMPSGDRKSAVLRSVVAPLYKLEHEWREAARPAVLRQQTRQEALQARKGKLVRKVGELEDQTERAITQSDLDEVAAELDEIGEPVTPRLLADDATPEVLAGLLAKHGRLAILSPEAPLIDNLIGRYDAKGSANLHLVCKAYSGEQTRIDRRARDSEQLDRPLLAITLAVQPHVLRGLIEHETARAQGLVGRFAYAVPESHLGSRRTDPPAAAAELHSAWEHIVRGVNTADPLTEPTQPGFVGSVSAEGLRVLKLSLSPSAKKHLDALRAEHEPRLRESGDLRPVADWIARHPGRVARIAALLHLAGGASPPRPIAEETMRSALRIGEYLLAHSLFALTTPDETTRRALGWLSRRAEETVSQRDLQRGPLGGRGTAEKAHDLAQALVEAGALRRVEDDGGPRPGRPSGPAYKVNPHLRDR